MAASALILVAAPVILLTDTGGARARRRVVIVRTALGRWWRTVVVVIVAMIGALIGLGLRVNGLPAVLDDVPTADAARYAGIFVLDGVLGLIALGLLPFVLGPRVNEPGSVDAAERPHRAIAGLLIISFGAFSYSAAVAGFIALVAIASRRRPRWTLAAVVAMVAAVSIDLVLSPPVGTSPLETLIGAAAVIGLLVLLGLYLGSRRQTLEALRLQVLSAARERAALADKARQAERTRIAREIHDTLSHRLSLIALHAGGLAYHPDVDVDTVRRTSELIHAAAQEASEELHGVLTLVRDDPGDREQAATTADLDRVLGQFSDAGLWVDLQLGAGGRDVLTRLAPAPSRCLMRVLHEALGNVVKHAPAQPVTVRLREQGSGVRLQVRNLQADTTSNLSGGFGLIGLHERVSLVGGRLRADARGTHFVVDAWVPWSP